ncbi:MULTISPECIES: DUF4350 domain-containing protein [unclassified Eikenella]|uniref:DUF4350 domain-containing protein n=1 Tax=unclassified Eikenella TaxID=2639367 RepID=UPI0007E0F01C|nr:MULTISPECIES: DUF4350 domain-containing protein [unclassified Eikenella]OAM28801.1 hypothetical protein A7P94_01965 [Eikenella sp. NML01-A-086]OAM41074.1 hypothetical protein A7Q02_07010 [Eikenella sp. NML97-A-109]
MKNRRSILIGLIAILLIGGLVAVAGLSKQESKTWQSLDPKQEMREGQLYGLKTLLTRYGVKNIRHERSLFGLGGLNAYDNNRLLIVADNRMRDKEDAERLLEWVGRGNHLVMALPSYADDNSLKADGKPGNTEDEDTLNFRQTMLRHLQIGTVELEEIDVKTLPNLPACVKAAEQRHEAARQVGDEVALKVDPHCNAGLSSIQLPEGATIQTFTGAEYSSTNGWAAQDSKLVLFQGKNAYGAIQTIRVRYGDGSVLLTWNDNWLGNPSRPDFNRNHLALYDHPYLAVYLAQEKDSILLADKVYPSDYNSAEPMIWKMLKSQPVLLAIALAAAAILLWRIVVRVGVVQQLPPAPERYLNQHLLAQGQFLTRHLSRRAILSDMQRRLLEALQQRHPAWKQMGSRKQLEFLCAQTKLPPSVVEPWLQPLPEQVNLVQWLQMLAAHQRIVRKINRSWY